MEEDATSSSGASQRAAWRGRAATRFVALASTLLSLAGAPALAHPPDAKAIVQRMLERTTPADEEGSMLWRIERPGEAEEQRQLRFRRKTGEEGRQLVLLRVLSPRELRRVGFLTVSGGEDEAQWVYLPDRGRASRVPPSDRAARVLGSDFAYADLKAEDLSAHVYKVLRQEDVDGAACDVIEALPAPGREARLPYPRRVLWIRQRDAFPIRTELFGEDGALWKTLRASALVEVGGYLRPDRLVMEDARTKGRTTVSVRDREVNQGIPDRVFTERELEAGR